MNNLDMHRWQKMYSVWMKMLPVQEAQLHLSNLFRDQYFWNFFPIDRSSPLSIFFRKIFFA